LTIQAGIRDLGVIASMQGNEKGKKAAFFCIPIYPGKRQDPTPTDYRFFLWTRYTALLSATIGGLPGFLGWIST
jgi:hypothetical protein